jgi:hypothetical protein
MFARDSVLRDIEYGWVGDEACKLSNGFVKAFSFRGPRPMGARSKLHTTVTGIKPMISHLLSNYLDY